MRLPFTFFLALRYLRPKRTFLSIITLICVVGVMLGVMVPIVVLSVMTGFSKELREKVVGFDAHLNIQGDGILRNWRELTDKVEKIDGITAIAPYVQGRVLVEFDNRRLAPYIRGINPDLEEKVSAIRKFIPAGSGEFDLSGNNAIIGADLAANLGIGLGDVVQIYSPANLGNILDELDKAEQSPENKASLAEVRELVLPVEVMIAGIFQSGRFAYDSDYLLVPLNVAQELYGLEDGIHGLTIKTNNADLAAIYQQKINQILVPPEQALTWMEQNAQLFNAILVERNVMFFLLLFIVIVAAFGIMSTLITTTVQKTREIGVIKALGASVSQILWVFLAQGIVVGFFGTLTGLGLGILVVAQRNEFRLWLSKTFQMEIFPSAIYQFTEIPAQVVPRDVALICVSAFFICTLAALIPAFFAARLDPVKALRFE